MAARLFEMTHAELFTSIRMNITDGKTETRGALCKMVERNIQHIPSQKTAILQRIRSVKKAKN
jgi:hypothetical protein